MNGRILTLALRRLHSRRGLTALSLLSVVLAVGMVASIPIFSQGVSYLLLRNELLAEGDLYHRPPLTTRLYFVAKENTPLSLQNALTFGESFRDLIAGRTGLPIKQASTRVDSPNLTLQPSAGDSRYPNTDRGVIKKDLSLSVVTDIGNYITIVEGAPFGELSRERVSVWAYARLSSELGLQVGENYEMVSLRNGSRIPITIAGIWREADLDDFIWSGTTLLWDNVLLITDAEYRRAVEPNFPQKTGFTAWYVVPDDAKLSLARADAAAAGLELAPSLADRHYPGVRLDVSPEAPLKRYLQRKASLSALLVGFSLPALGLLFYFMWLLSSVTAQFQREEAAILAGRGVSRGFFIMLAVVETVLLLAVGLPLGLGLSYAMARLMGLASDFLVFTRRAEFPASLWEADWRLLGAALLILLLARLIPTLAAARAGIVLHLRQRSRPRLLSGLLKLAVDGALVVVTLYTYQQLSRRGSLGVIGWEPSGDPFRDPLLLLTPSIFVLTGAMLLTHLFPLLMRPLDQLSGRVKSFPVYMAVRQLYRQGGHYSSSLCLVMICLSLGAFYSSMALSLNEWLVDRIRYQAGADYKFQQGMPPDLSGTSEFDRVARSWTDSWLLPPSDYLAIPGVEKVARAGQFKASVNFSLGGDPIFLGIDRVALPQVLYYRNDFSEAALGELMNRLGMYPEGVLVSRRFLERTRLLEGQRLPMKVQVDDDRYEVEFQIVGVYDFFPTAYPSDREVIVGNLDSLFAQVGNESFHQIWMKTDPTVDPASISAAVVELGVYPILKVDARALISLDEERVERIGLFGVLSVGFLATALLACLGLLVYTYSSLQGRLQQISVLRAIGIQTGQILRVVSLEYAGVIIYGIVGGMALGLLTSHLFVPFFRISGDPVFALPPFVRHIDWGKISWLTLAFLAALALSQAIILRQATRRDIFQILRMGQRE